MYYENVQSQLVIYFLVGLVNYKADNGLIQRKLLNVKVNVILLSYWEILFNYSWVNLRINKHYNNVLNPIMSV